MLGAVLDRGVSIAPRSLDGDTRDRRKRVAAWRASGLSAEDFALGRGLNADAPQEMGQQLRKVEPAVRLARLEIGPQHVSEVPVVLRAGAVRVEVVSGFSRETLAAVLEGGQR